MNVSGGLAAYCIRHGEHGHHERNVHEAQSKVEYVVGEPVGGEVCVGNEL